MLPSEKPAVRLRKTVSKDYPAENSATMNSVSDANNVRANVTSIAPRSTAAPNTPARPNKKVAMCTLTKGALISDL